MYTVKDAKNTVIDYESKHNQEEILWRLLCC